MSYSFGDSHDMERGKLHMRTFPPTFGRYYGTCLLVDLVRGQPLPTPLGTIERILREKLDSKRGARIL